MNVLQARRIVDDLRGARAGEYFRDVGSSVLVGWLLLAVASGSWPALLRFSLVIVAAVFFYRALGFIHELFHQQELTRFRLFWHVVVGVPLLLPLLLYLPIHQAHHNAHAYGTDRDGEYEQFKGRLAGMTLRLLGLNLLLPLALLVRFAVLTPLGAVVPFVRREVIPAFVHLSLRMPFKAPEMRGAAAAEAKWVEVACMLWAWVLLVGLFTGYHALVGLWALLLVAVATLNTVRALCSTHLYVEQPQGRDTLGQLADSLNIGGNNLLTKLLCPVGLQYHALHHLAPYLPYHALPEAHRRLMEQLPADSLYHRVTVPNLYQGWRRLVQATDARAEPSGSGVTPS